MAENENPVEATTIVQNFVLLLVKHMQWKQKQKKWKKNKIKKKWGKMEKKKSIGYFFLYPPFWLVLFSWLLIR
jgi:hypothetical protein